MKMQNLLNKGGSMFRKKVKLFRWSVPLSMVVALVIVTTAAAIWGITAFTINFNVTSSSQDSVNVIAAPTGSVCIVIQDAGTGTGPTSCQATVITPNLSVNINNASPGDEYQVNCSFSAPNTNGANLYAQPLDVTAWGGVLDLVSDVGCGTLFSPGSTMSLRVNFKFDTDGQNTNPSSSYGPFPIVRQFAPTVPTCP